jgi:hypothetical protein
MFWPILEKFSHTDSHTEIAYFYESTREGDRFKYISISKLMVQGAIIIIANYAAQIDFSCSEEEIKRIVGINYQYQKVINLPLLT